MPEKSRIHHIARNVAFSLLGFAWPVVLLLVATPAVLHGLGEARYGVWALVGNILGYLSVFNSLQTAGTKYLAEFLATGDHATVAKLLGTSLAFNVAVGVSGGVAIALLAEPLSTTVLDIPPELQREATVAFWLAGIGFGVNTVGWWGASILAGTQRFDWLTGVVIGTTTAATAGTVWAAASGVGVVGVAAVNVAAAVLSVALYAVGAHRVLPGFRWALSYDRAMMRRILAFGVFSSLQVIFGVIALQLDRTLLGAWVGVAAVAAYSIPLSIAARIHQLCAKALEVVFPLASGLEAQRQSDAVARLFLRAQNLNVVLVLGVAVPLFVLAPDILRLWISPSYAAEAGTVLRLLTVAYSIVGLGVAAGAMAAGFGRPEVNTAYAAALGIISLVGYVVLIPRWGVAGAGTASLIGAGAATLPFVWYVNRRFIGLRANTVLRASVARPSAAALVVGVALVGVRPWMENLAVIAGTIAGAGLVYVAATIRFGVWHADELSALRHAWTRLHRRASAAAMADG